MKHPGDPEKSVGRLPLIFGWWALAGFIAMGLFLESLHLVKAPFYFEVEIRRELWTLAHAHGGLLAVVNIAYALCGGHWQWRGAPARWGGRLIVAAGVMVPVGFFLGGIGNSESDPSLWILLTPLGGAAALAAAALAGWSAWRCRADDDPLPDETVSNPQQPTRRKRR